MLFFSLHKHRWGAHFSPLQLYEHHAVWLEPLFELSKYEPAKGEEILYVFLYNGSPTKEWSIGAFSHPDLS
jgi:hypothetical protein